MITRAQIRRQLRKNGGIMNAVPRQGYFLGGVGDFISSALGKAKDVVSNVVKSPVGKAALLGLGGAGLMGMGPLSGLGGIGARVGGSGIGQFVRGMGPKLFGVQGIGGPAHGAAEGFLGKLGLTKGFGSKMPTVFGGITGASLLTYFMSKGKTEEEAKELAQDVYRGEGLGLDIIQADMKNYRSGALSGSQAYDKGYRFLTPRSYMQAAMGGRVGFQDGTQKIPSSKKQRQEDYSLGMYEAGDIQKETPDRDIIKDFPDTTQDMLASYLSKRKRGVPMDQVQTDLIQTYGLSNYSRFMKILKEEGLGDYKYKLGGTDLGPREMIEETTQYPEMAIGGRVGLKKGSPHGKTDKEVLEELYPTLFSDTTTSIEGSPKKKKNYKKKADGGRIGYQDGMNEPMIKLGMNLLSEGTEDMMEDFIKRQKAIENIKKGTEVDPRDKEQQMRKRKRKIIEQAEKRFKQQNKKADGGRIGKYGGGVTSAMPRIPTGMPRVNAGGISELDYRQEGGFVPMGVKEKADDVPAMLSKNEFVMTADAVKGAGGGNVEKGAQKMYNTMKQLEGRIA